MNLDSLKKTKVELEEKNDIRRQEMIAHITKNTNPKKVNPNILNEIDLTKGAFHVADPQGSSTNFYLYFVYYDEEEKTNTIYVGKWLAGNGDELEEMNKKHQNTRTTIGNLEMMINKLKVEERK